MSNFTFSCLTGSPTHQSFTLDIQPEKAFDFHTFASAVDVAGGDHVESEDESRLCVVSSS